MLHRVLISVQVFLRSMVPTECPEFGLVVLSAIPIRLNPCAEKSLCGKEKTTGEIGVD